VTLVDTGAETMTGGRVKCVAPYLDGQPFMLTYGDGVADVNIKDLVEFHRTHGKQATVTSIQPAGRFGALDLDAANRVHGFQEKPKGDGSWVNGGFFVLEPDVLERISGEATVFEKEPMEGLARDGELVAYKHDGFWQPMDTLRDKNHLEELWSSGKAPWKVW
jgi:glucose-1-phosphate cytidylyltransferase